MDLLCSESLLNDCEVPLYSYKQKQQQQQQIAEQQQQQQQSYISSNSSSSSCSSTCSSNGSSTISAKSDDAGTSVGVATLISPAHASTDAAGGDGNGNANKLVYVFASVAAAAQPQQQQQQQQQQHINSISANGTATAATGGGVGGFSQFGYVNRAIEDPTFNTDRCLENALKAEEKHQQIVETYFKTVQRDITPPMRKIVAEWMMEVCAEEKCHEKVVLLALNYMDRFLSTKSVRKTHLQILAAACLLLASKLREPSCRALSADLLVFYTDNSIYKDDLIKWELYVLSRLGWDLSSVTPLDFLELLIIRLPIRSKHFPDLNMEKVRQHAQAFISLAAKEHHFAKYTASTIAASSIAASMSGLKWHLRTGHNLHFLLSLLTDLTSVEQDQLQECMLQMETIFEEHSRKLQPFLVSVQDMQQQQQQQHQDLQPPAMGYYQRSHHHLQPTAAASYHRSQHCPRSQQQQQQLQQQPHQASSSSATQSLQQRQRYMAALPDLTQNCKMQAQAQSSELQDIKF